MKKINYFLLLLLFQCFSFYNINAQVSTVVDVNLNTQRSVEGVSEFDRNVFINMHSSHTISDWDSDELDRVANELGVNFGRSVGGVTWQMNRIDEDPNQPGFFDLTHMQTLGQQSRNWYANQHGNSPYEPETFVMTSHTSPLIPNGTPTNQGWTPANHESVAQFYAHLLKYYYGENGEPIPTYLEVVNEPFVHANELNTTNADISEFHNVVADSVRFHNPEVKVGGYTAAWPELERNNFGVWDGTWRTFIDIAGANMDFFSFHLYDHPKADGQAQRKGSNVEAIFDLIEQYSVLQLGEVKPMIISEYGACCADWDGPYYEERDWLQLKSISSMTMALMERPNKILKAIPFIVDKATWYSDNAGYPYPHVLLQNTNGGFEWEYTHLQKYYQLWRNVEGTRVDTWAHDPDIQIDAFVKNNKAVVVLNNLEHADRNIELNLFETEGNTLQEISTKHLYGMDGTPQLEELTYNTLPDNFFIGREGTMVIEYTYADDIALTQMQEESKHYADKYLQPISSNNVITFNIDNVTTSGFGEATLRIGLGRAHGKSLHPTVTVNGTVVNVPTDWRGYDQATRENFLGVLEVPVPFDLVQTNNVVTVQLDDTGGHVSTVTLQVKNFDYDPVRTTVATQEIPAWAADLSLYPNPTRGKVQFAGLEKLETLDVSIFDLNGKKVWEGKIDQNNATLNTEQLPKGMYQVQLRVEVGMVVKKLIVL